MKRPLVIAFLCVAQLARAAENFDYAEAFRAIELPPDFTIQLAAGAPTLKFPMFACFDDKGALYVTESSGKDLYAGLKNLDRECRVLRLEDRDRDGAFEKSTVFQDKVTFSMGLAWRDGKLFLADPPDLIALTDNNNDGVADKREVIITGFGHTDNGSLHGLTFGPDGMLYFTMGEPDGYRLPRGDDTFLEGVSGALFRSKPDGSQIEVISRGFENLVEVEFLPGGEIIGTDNWYQVPSGGLRDALVDLAPGGLYPYAPDRGAPQPRTGLTLPSVILLPAVAHSGLTRLRTTAFPQEWSNDLFVAEHNTRKIARHELRRAGSTFASTSHDFIASEHPDFHPSDILEDPNGSLLVIDTGGWYVEHCPTGKIRDSRAPGGIYRVRWTKAQPRAPQPIDPLDQLASDIRAEKIPPASHLASNVARIRRAAAETLARTGSRADCPQLLHALLNSQDAFEEHACINALLALADEPFIRPLLQHPSPKIRRAALNILDHSTLRFADLVGPLGAEDEALRASALNLLQRHPTWSAEAVPFLRKELPAPAAIKLLVAFKKDPAVRGLVTAFVNSPAILSILPTLQPLEPAWLDAIESALNNPTLRASALPAATHPRFKVTLQQIANDETIPLDQRLRAARTSEPRPTLSEKLFAAALNALTTTNRYIAEDLLAHAALTDAQRAAAKPREAPAPENRLERLNALKPLFQNGDAASGREVFNLACAVCHQIANAGGQVGPDLTKVGAIRSGNDLLESIVFPNSTFAQGYETYQATRRDGAEITGILLSKTADLTTLRDTTGATHHIASPDLADLKRLDTSLMPSGFDESLTGAQLRDLLAYLQHLK